LPTVCDVPCTSANHATFMHATYFAISRVACAAPPAGRAQSRRAPRRCRRRRSQSRPRCARTSAARAPARAAARARGEGELSKRPGDAPNWAQNCSRQDAACADNDTLLRTGGVPAEDSSAVRAGASPCRCPQCRGPDPKAPRGQRASRSSAAAAAAAARARSSGKRSFSTSRRYRMPSRI